MISFQIICISKMLKSESIGTVELYFNIVVTEASDIIN